MKIEEKVRNSNKRYENRREGTNFKGKYAKQRNETFFSVSRNNSKHFFRIFVFFQFRETIETRRNSDRFRTVSDFAKLKKKYETVNPLLRESLLIYMKYLTMAYYLYRYFVNIYRNWRLFPNCLTFNSVLPFLISVQSDRSSWLCIYLYIYIYI